MSRDAPVAFRKVGQAVRTGIRSLEGGEWLAVCGAGAAGMAAALAAARAGAEVCLIEARPRPGGTVGHSLIHTLGGLYDSRGELLNDGLSGELAGVLAKADPRVCRRRIGRAWVLSVCPDVYRAAAQGWLERAPRLTALYDTRVVGVVREGDRIAGLEAEGPGGLSRLRTRAVVDATGTAEVVRLLGPALVEEDDRRAAGGLIFCLGGVAPGALAFPRGLGVRRALRRAAEEGNLPADCRHAWLDSGVREDEVYVKLFVPLPGDWREREARGEVTAKALRSRDAVLAFLKALPEFARAEVSQTGLLGVRDGGRVRGEYRLTAEDVRQGRRFADAACRCCWPIEYWDPEEGVSVEYLPEDAFYEVPLRALKVRGVRNLWAAGKCLSADRHAHASARVAGTCWAMGAAAGTAAAH
jgi:hypothetical protein